MRVGLFAVAGFPRPSKSRHVRFSNQTDQTSTFKPPPPPHVLTYKLGELKIIMPGLSPIQQTILPDILGFAPQLLVDDLLDIGYDAIAKATGALETYLDTNWLPGRPIEDQNEAYAGLVAFQTLLQSHLDKAFDAFELWSLKNVFALPDPAEVPIVLPHQTGLDITATEQEENSLNKEIEELRAKVDAVSAPFRSAGTDF